MTEHITRPHATGEDEACQAQESRMEVSGYSTTDLATFGLGRLIFDDKCKVDRLDRLKERL
jgi:hypothetical protein